METIPLKQWPIVDSAQDDHLEAWIGAFMVDRKSQNFTRGTLYYYQKKLQLFSQFCDGQLITRIGQITPDTIRRYLLRLEAEGHNPGGVHQAYRTLKTFLYWWEAEVEPEGWKNPIRRVKAPKVPTQTIAPVELDTVHRLIETCKGGAFIALRDKALLFFLLDTGLRAFEVCAVNLEDIDLMGGAVLIRQGKGGKPRTVFIGQKARRALRAYLKQRREANPALWLTQDQERLTYWGLNEIVRRRSKAAGVKKPGLHDFRRAFALNFLRNGGDIYSLQRLMGHADLQVLRRYLAQTDQDLQAAHRRGSPVDRAEF